MPRKIRQLESELRLAGLVKLPKRGKGSHGWWSHPTVPVATVNLSGKPGDDAKPYQEDAVREAIRKVREATRR